MGRNKGYRHSSETIDKMRRAKAGAVFSEEHKQKLSIAAKKRGIDKEWRQHMIDGRKKKLALKIDKV